MTRKHTTAQLDLWITETELTAATADPSSPADTWLADLSDLDLIAAIDAIQPHQMEG